jgi:O-antigen biosynthesis protein
MIDVIVPVHGAGPAFRRCAVSLVRHVGAGEARLVVVLDGPADAEVRAGVDALRRGAFEIEVIEHAAPRGFAASVNAGAALSDRDVVLLNSDTQVTAGWLRTLAEAAASRPRVATVTPFSNNATIASLPVTLVENAIPAGYDIDTFAALVASRSARAYPELPTGVGACLYVRRQAMVEIGAFDDAFGLGYGEEVDFCLRASARGYVHLLGDATFVFHEGNRSFGASRATRVRRAERTIARRFPHYRRLVHDAIVRDALAPLRARVTEAIAPRRAEPTSRPSVVHLVHGWPPWARGGAEHYAAWLARAQAATRAVAVYARLGDADRRLGDAVEYLDAGVRVRLVVNNFATRDPIARNGLHSRVLARDFGRFLDDVRPGLVHVHHLAGHCATLIGVARRRGLPIVYQAQDWWPACARVNLCDRDGRECPGPAALRCARCLPLTSKPPATLASAALHRVRRAVFRHQLAKVDAVVGGSRFVLERSARFGIWPASTPTHVVPYGVPAAAPPTGAAGERGAGPLHFGVVGALLPHKGAHLAVEAWRRVGDRAHLHLWGSSGDAAYRERLASLAAATPGVHLHGAFADDARAGIFAAIDALIVPSIGWESFGLAAREAWAHGVPVIAAARSALAELFPSDGAGGTTFAPDDAGALADLVLGLADRPARVEVWRRAIPPVKTVAAHAAEIDAIYDTVVRPARA